nr:MAG TPA: hypothetical protein [Caudoviricetes sp.]
MLKTPFFSLFRSPHKFSNYLQRCGASLLPAGVLVRPDHSS